MNNPIGIYYGYFAQTEQLLWEDYALCARRCGAEAIEMSALTLQLVEPARQERIAALVRDLGLKLTFATAISREADISSDDAAQRALAVRNFQRQIALAAKMGATRIGGILNAPGKYMPPGIAFSKQRYLDNAVEPLRRAGQIARDCGVTLGVEVVNRFESPLINTVAEGMAFVRAVDSPGVGLHIDSFHMNIEEDDPCAAIRAAAGNICHVHFAENNRKLPGFGRIDFKAHFQALQAAGYEGIIVVESLAKPYGEFSDRLNIWRSYVREDMETDLRQSLQMLQSLKKMI